MFVRNGRTLPYVPVTLAALRAIDAVVPQRRKAYARSLYLALLDLANEAQGDRAAVTRRELGERAGCSREMVSDLRPLLEQAGVVVVYERQHGGQTLEHEWCVIEPGQVIDAQPETTTPVPARHDPPVPTRHDPRACEAQGLKEEEERERESARAREREDPRMKAPADFPDALRPHAREVYRVLCSVAEQHHTKKVWPLAVGRVVMAHPRHPLVATAHALAAWAVDPDRPVKDVVSTYRTFLGRRTELASTEFLAEDGTPGQVLGSGRLPDGVTPIRRDRVAEREARSADRQVRFARAMAEREQSEQQGDQA